MKGTSSSPPGLKAGLLGSTASFAATSLCQLSSVPLLIWALGIERYGIIAFTAILLGLLPAIDFGAGQTIARIMAAASVKGGGVAGIMSAARWVVLLPSVSAALTLAFFSQQIVGSWLDVPAGLRDEAALALCCLSPCLVLQALINLNGQAMVGLGQVARLAPLQVLSAILGTFGAILVAAWSGSLPCFFLSQVVFQSLTLLFQERLLVSVTPIAGAPDAASPSLMAERGVMMLNWIIALESIAIMFFDRFVASARLDLLSFTAVGVAGAISGFLIRLNGSISLAFYQRVASSTATSADERGARVLLCAQVTAACIMPAAVVLACNSGRAIFAWTGSAGLGAIGGPVGMLLMIGTILNSAATAPFLVLLGSGRLMVPIVANAISMAVAAPLSLLAIGHFGAVGAATTWLAINIVGLCVVTPFMCRHHAGITFSSLMMRAYLLPVLAGALIGLGMAILPLDGHRIPIAIMLAVGSGAATAVALLFCPATKRKLLPMLHQWTGRA